MINSVILCALFAFVVKFLVAAGAEKFQFFLLPV
jgi:hypothetical protein